MSILKSYSNNEWVTTIDEVSDIVRTDISQSLTETEKTTARYNVNAHKLNSPLPSVFTTELPTSNNEEGIKIYYGEEIPAVKYSGWLYLIKSTGDQDE